MGANNRIKDLRKQAGLTQKQIGGFLSIDQSMVAKLESGERKLTTVQLSKLANLFSCSEDYLLGTSSENEEMNFAFRIDGMGSEELEVVASINKVAGNINMLNTILEGSDEK